MYDIGKAFTMIISVLMFVAAATVSLYLYHNVDKQLDSVMLSSNHSNRGDAIVASVDQPEDREIKRAEVIISILNLKNNEEDKVRVGGLTYYYREGKYYIVGIDDGFDTTDSGFLSAIRSISNRAYHLSSSTEHVLSYY